MADIVSQIFFISPVTFSWEFRRVFMCKNCDDWVRRSALISRFCVCVFFLLRLSSGYRKCSS